MPFRHWNKPARAIAGGLLLTACTLLTACASPAWYAQAAGGQWGLLRDRQDIDSYLQTATADDPLAARLQVAREVLDFAGAQLDMPPGDAYRSFVRTGRDAVTWNVVAAPELSLEPKRWCHLVAGCLPYLGWFDVDDAQRHAERLAQHGLDTAVAPAGAYSTLGWFEDPLLDSMLARSDAALAAVLIHELAHRRLFVRGDAAFSESYASFIEQAGTQAWLAASGRSGEAQAWAQRQAAWAEFRALLAETRRTLQAIYASESSDAQKRIDKQAVFAELRRRHDAQAAAGRSTFSSWFEPPPNNAKLALAGTYQGGQCAFQALFEAQGGDFARFHAALSGLARSSQAQRSAWLAADC